MGKRNNRKNKAPVHRPSRSRAIGWCYSEAFRETWSVILVLVLTAAMLWPAVKGDWPVGHDHPVHVFRIWQFEQNLLHHHTPWAWTNRWFAGCPISVVYPIGADLFVTGVHALSLGKLDIGSAYGVAFWLFYFLYGYGAYYFISRATESRIAALIGVLFLLCDSGNNDVGGWFWFVDAGVWTAALASAPALIGTIHIARLLNNPTPRSAAFVGICVGLALLCHPLQIVYFGITVPLLLAARFITHRVTEWRATSLWLAVAFVCGLLIASFSLIPYIAASSYISEVGALGSTLPELGRRLAAGQIFPRMLWFAAAFGLAGCLLLLATARRPLVLFMGSIVFVCIIFSSSSFVNLFGVEFAKWAGKHMTFNRLLMLIKPFWYGAAGFLLVTAARGIGQFVRRGAEQRDAEWGKVRQWISAAGMALFVSGFVLPVLYYTLAVFVRNEVLRPTQWHSERPDLAARDAFVAWAKAQSRDESQFFRIAYGFEADEHTLAVLNKDIPFPMYKVWNTPTGHFKYNVDSSTNQALRAVNVRYALTERPISRPDFNLERTFDGRLRLYSFKDWDPKPFVVNGGGKVRLVSLRDERIVLRAEPGASGSLRLNVSYFPKWRATRDGVPVPITAVPAAGVEKSAFMQVPLAPGIYEFRYRRGFSDSIGMLLGLVGLAACLGLSNPERSRNIAVGAVKRLHQFIGQIARRSRSA